MTKYRFEHLVRVLHAFSPHLSERQVREGLFRQVLAERRRP